MESLESKIQRYVKSELAAVPPVPCDFKVGDTVTFTNDYGLVFTGIKVIGFSREIDPDWRPESFIYLDWASYWFPTCPAKLKLEERAVS